MLARLDFTVTRTDVGHFVPLEPDARLVIERHAGPEHDLVVLGGATRAHARARQIADAAGMQHHAGYVFGPQLANLGCVALAELAQSGFARHDRGRGFLDQLGDDGKRRTIIIVARRRRAADEYGMIHLRAIALHGGVDLLVDDLSHLDRLARRLT